MDIFELHRHCNNRGRVGSELDSIAKVFKTLSDSTRLRIVELLNEDCCSVSAIVDATGRSQPLVSHHLRVLRETGLARTERQGARVIY